MIIPLHNNVMRTIFSLFLLALFSQHATSLNFNIPNIGKSDQSKVINVYDNAKITSQGIEFTTIPNPKNKSAPFNWQAGRATYYESFHLWDQTSGKVAGFTTHFKFVIDSTGSNQYGDGLAFFLIPNDSLDSDILSGAACGLPVDIPPYNQRRPTVAVEFDTFYNPQWDPPKIATKTHVGINVNSLQSVASKEWYSDVPNGVEYEAWISYYPSSKIFNVVFTNHVKNKRVELSRFNFLIDLKEYLPEYVAIGFSAATGGLVEKHYVKSWEFNST